MKKTAEPADLVMGMGKNFREASERFSWSDVLLVLAIAGLVAVGVWLLVRYVNHRESRGVRDPKRLFFELCAAHRLDRAKRKLLMRLALAHQLEYPAALFLSPESFDAAQLDAPWHCEQAALEELRDSIFGRRLPDEQPAA